MSDGKYDDMIQKMAALAQEAADDLEGDAHLGPATTITAGASVTGAVLEAANELARIADALEAIAAAGERAERAASPARFVAGVSEVTER